MIHTHRHPLGEGAGQFDSHIGPGDEAPLSQTQPIDSRADLRDGAHAVTAQDMGQSRLGRVKPFGQVTIGGVEGGKVELENGLVLARRRFWGVAQPEPVQASEFINNPSFHAQQMTPGNGGMSMTETISAGEAGGPGTQTAK